MTTAFTPSDLFPHLYTYNRPERFTTPSLAAYLYLSLYISLQLPRA